MDERWKSNFVSLLYEKLRKRWVYGQTVEMKGALMVEIKIYIFTIEKVEKKMGGRTVEIKIYIFTKEKGKKNG